MALHSQIQMDPDFGSAGLQRVTLAPFNRTIDLKAAGADRFYLLGDCGNLQTNPNFDLFLLKMDLQGNLDSSFADSGWLKVDFAGFNMSSAREMSILADDRILILGEAFDLNNQADRKAALLMLHPDGRTDSTFGTNGTLILSFLGSRDYPETLIQDANQMLNFGGAGLETAHGGSLSPTVARFNSAGGLDSSFGGTGKIAVLPDSQAYALKYTGVNHLNGGIVHSLLPLPSGKLLVGGTYSVSGTNIGFITRLTDYGAIDSSFATDGTVYINLVPGQNHQINRLELLSDGSIFFSAKSLVLTGMDFMVGRINADGTVVTPEYIELGGDDEVHDLVPFANGMIAAGVGDDQIGLSWLSDATSVSIHQEMLIDFDGNHPSEATAALVIDGNMLICAGRVETGNVGESDLAIVGLRIPTTLEIPTESSAPEYTLYPNPNQGNFILHSDSRAALKIYDLAGRLIAQQQIRPGQNRIELSGRNAPGLYHAVLLDERAKMKAISFLMQ